MLAYTAVGSGPAVVLLHGFPLSRAIWLEQVADLQTRYQVIVPDLPGHGESAPLTDAAPPTMARMAQEVLALLDHLGVERAAVVGHSMGGYVALALHQLAPQRVAGLGLVATQAFADSPAAAAGRLATAEKVLAEGAGVVAGGMGPNLFGPAVTSDSALFQQVDAIMRSTSVPGVRDALHAMAARADLREHLGTVRVPALVVAGAADKVVPADRTQDLADRIAGATVVSVAGAGHLPMLEEPGVTSGALAHWLRQVYPS